MCFRGFTQFISRDDLLSDTFLGDTDTLTVRVDVHLWKHTSPYSLLSGCAPAGWCRLVVQQQLMLSCLTRSLPCPARPVEIATEYAGLKNQGATCYLNSLLQTLFHLRAFRKAVYAIPTKEGDQPESCIPLALQRLFYNMERAPGSRHPEAVGTKQLTASFGWTSAESFQQHDVQELSRVLCDTLEEKMKGTVVEGALGKLFQGQTVSTVSCTDVDYSSSRQETFMDLQLVVSGCADVAASIGKFCEKEVLEGDNKFEAGDHGKQNAVRSMTFASLPPVLQLQLKRFEYDLQRGTSWKVNDRHSFPIQLDMSPFLEKPPASPDDAIYLLHSVLVHSGGVHSGHYYAFINPTCEPSPEPGDAAAACDDDDGPPPGFAAPAATSPWLRFDDERVTREPRRHAVEDNFGEHSGSPQPVAGPDGLLRPAPWRHPATTGRVSSAYMLVYIRKSELLSVARCPCSCAADLAPAVAARFDAEREEKERRRTEREEAHLYTAVRVFTDADIAAHVGRATFDLVDLSADTAPFLAQRLRVDTPLGDLVASVRDTLAAASSATNSPVPDFRLWLLEKRENETWRPGKLLTVPGSEDSATVSQLARDADSQPRSMFRPGAAAGSELRLYLELPDVSGGTLPLLAKDSCLLFLKHYLPPDDASPAAASGQLVYGGHVVVSTYMRVADMRPLLPLPPGDEPLLFFEEIRFSPSLMVDTVRPRDTLKEKELGMGDILIWQKAPQPTAPGAPQPRFADAQAYLTWVASRTVVMCHPLPRATDRLADAYGAQQQQPGEAQSVGSTLPVVRLELTADAPYEEVAAALVAGLGSSAPECVAHLPSGPGGRDYVRFTGQSTLNPVPRSDGPFRSTDKLPLRQLASLPYGAAAAAAAAPAVLYYEVLDMPVAQLEQLRQLTVDVFNDAVARVATLTVRLPRDRCTAADCLGEVQRQLAGEAACAALSLQPLMLLHCHGHRVWHVNVADGTQLDVNEAYWHIRAEPVVIGENGGGEGEEGSVVIHVTHAQREPGGYLTHFGHPFLLAVTHSDTLGDVKLRIAAKLGLAKAELDAWKFSVHAGWAAGAQHLGDDAPLLAAFGASYRGPPDKVYDTFLAMEHPGPVRRPGALGLKIHSDSRQNLAA